VPGHGLRSDMRVASPRSSRPAAKYFLAMGVLWTLLAAGQWPSSSDRWVKISYTVLAVAWLGLGLVQVVLRTEERWR